MLEISVCDICVEKPSCLVQGVKKDCKYKAKEEAFNLLVERVIEKHNGVCPEVLGYDVQYKDIKKCGLIDCKDCWREVIG